MKKLVIAIAAIAAFSAPAAAADLAARPYTKAPPMIAALYDWSGFYVGANGGWGSSHKCWGNYAPRGFVASQSCPDATGGVARAPIGYLWPTRARGVGVGAHGRC